VRVPTVSVSCDWIKVRNHSCRDIDLRERRLMDILLVICQVWCYVGPAVGRASQARHCVRHNHRPDWQADLCCVARGSWWQQVKKRAQRQSAAIDSVLRVAAKSAFKTLTSETSANQTYSGVGADMLPEAFLLLRKNTELTMLQQETLSDRHCSPRQ
jgi:hypothetical protein